MLILAVNSLAVNGAISLYVVSKSIVYPFCSVENVLHAFYSVEKCGTHALRAF